MDALSLQTQALAKIFTLAQQEKNLNLSDSKLKITANSILNNCTLLEAAYLLPKLPGDFQKMSQARVNNLLTVENFLMLSYQEPISGNSKYLYRILSSEKGNDFLHGNLHATEQKAQLLSLFDSLLDPKNKDSSDIRSHLDELSEELLSKLLITLVRTNLNEIQLNKVITLMGQGPANLRRAQSFLDTLVSPKFQQANISEQRLNQIFDFMSKDDANIGFANNILQTFSSPEFQQAIIPEHYLDQIIDFMNKQNTPTVYPNDILRILASSTFQQALASKAIPKQYLDQVFILLSHESTRSASNLISTLNLLSKPAFGQANIPKHRLDQIFELMSQGEHYSRAACNILQTLVINASQLANVPEDRLEHAFDLINQGTSEALGLSHILVYLCDEFHNEY